MFKEYIGKRIVVDTPHPILYVGELNRVTNDFIELVNADIHDGSISKNTKEQYLIEAAKGIFHPNRKAIIIKQTSIISISKLEDILIF